MSLIVTHALLNWTTRHHWGFGVFVAYILYRSYLEISTCTFNSHPIIHDFSKTLPQNIGWSSIVCTQYLAVGRTLFNTYWVFLTLLTASLMSKYIVWIHQLFTSRAGLVVPISCCSWEDLWSNFMNCNINHPPHPHPPNQPSHPSLFKATKAN